jgi:drug/metabolite transporter (DMT)-like permease
MKRAKLMIRRALIIGPGVPLALAAAALFGASTPLAKLLLGEMAPWLLAGLLYLGSGVGLACVAALRAATGVAPAEAPLRRADLPWLGAAVIAGGVIAPVLLLLGLAQSAAAATALLLNLEGLFTLLIAWLAFREHVDRRIVLGAGAILGGAAVLSWQPGVGAGIGPGALAVAGACLFWAIDNNLTRRLAAADPLQIAAAKGLVAGSINLALALLQGAPWPAAGATLLAGVVGLGGFGVSLVLFVLALRNLGTARTTGYFSTAPFIGALLAVALLGEPLTATLLVGAALMAVGLWLHLAERHAHQHAHAPLSHEHRHVHDVHHRHGHRPLDPAGEPHTHAHEHTRLVHAHPHYPDLHHRHEH